MSLKTIICGTNFGQIYLRGISLLPQYYELVGILARGSEKARNTAKQYNVPLYTDVKQLPSGIDLACVVIRSSIVGGIGNQIAQQLLQKGINVIQEQPIHSDELLSCLRLAKQNHCHYQINSFYPTVHSVTQFITCAKKLLALSTANYLNADCCLQVLFPLLDIIGQSLGGLKPYSLALTNEKDKKNIYPFQVFTGIIHHIPVQLRIHNQINSNDPDNYMPMFHRIELATSAGSLLLTDTHGAVLWFPFRPVQSLSITQPQSQSNIPICELVSPINNNSYQTILENTWPQAIASKLEHYYWECQQNNQSEYAQQQQYSLALCSLWQTIGQSLGETILTNQIVNKSLRLSDILQ